VPRLDPLGERQDLLDTIEVQPERQADRVSRCPEPEVPCPTITDPSRSPQGELHLQPPDLRLNNDRRPFYDRDRGYRLRASEIRTLADLGKFRILGVEDLAIHAYSGHRDAMDEDLGNLRRQGLVQNGRFQGPEDAPRELLSLTERAFGLVRANQLVAKDQTIYYGFVKPREAGHDADLYPLYQKQTVRILEEGGRNPKVILEFELKRNINRDLATLGKDARPEIARHHGLRVVRGRIPVPDLRIEYEKPDGQTARVDLELVTEHYRGQSLADKIAAGFTLYTPRGEAGRLRGLLAGQELAAEILSL
jgi:hypothetical protein